MITVNHQNRIIPYGATHWDEKTFSSSSGTDGALIIACRSRFIVIDPKKAAPLRLNGGQYAFQEPPIMRILPTVWDQLAFLEDHLVKLCGTWSKYQRLFVARYFDFIRLRVEEERPALSQMIEAFGNLYEYRDWAFSAPRPLPQAYVYAPKETGSTAPPQADDFTAADMAFWTGQNILILDLSDPNSTDPFQQRRHQRVKNAGIDILALPPAVLDDDNNRAFRALLPQSFQNFWHGELAPSRPFVDTKLGDITASEIDF